MSDTIGVCGLGRCGSTMVMTMLKAGGIEPCEGSADVSFELPEISTDALTRVDLVGRSVKLLDCTKYHGLPPGSWRFIWIDRDPVEQSRSAAKFITWGSGRTLAEYHVRALRDLCAADRPMVLGNLRRTGPVLLLEFERVLAQPVRAAKSIARFVDVPFDVQAAAAVVHDRGPGCLPDMSFEEAL